MEAALQARMAHARCAVQAGPAAFLSARRAMIKPAASGACPPVQPQP